MFLMLSNLLSSPSNLIEAKCVHFKICGGCKTQDVPYEEQLHQKQVFVSSCFEQATLPIIPCEPDWHYRNKMEYSFSQDRQGNKYLGLMKQRGRVENLYECFLTPPWFIQTLIHVRSWWEKSALTAYFPPKNSGTLRTLTLRGGVYTKEKMAILTTSEEPIDQELLSELVKLLPEMDSIILRKQIVKKKTPTRFEQQLLKGPGVIHEKLHHLDGQSLTFRVRPASFFQPCTTQAEKLYRKVLEMGDFSPEETVFDLYCGTGTLGMFVSHAVKQVIGVELVPDAVEDAHVNLHLNKISNVEVLGGDVAAILPTLPLKPSTVIVDPPRAGLGEKAIQILRTLAPKKIVYVSCNPASQAADCQKLGYHVSALQPVDQFPHTPHVENIALLHAPAMG